jgi:peptidyl-prolyl cis-trans isomerase B (cyclophilin B)
MKKAFSIITFSLFFFILTSCGQKKDYVVTIKTKYGDMVAVLYDETPKHKANFIKLAKEHYFDSLLFHRVIQGFMIQTGDPDSRKAKPAEMLGKGGPDYTIEAEFNPQFFHEKGALSAARLPDQQNPAKASSGSQFYIVQGTKLSEAELKIDQVQLNTAMQQYFQNPNNKPAYDSIIHFYNSGDMKGYQAYIVKLKPRVEKETGIKADKDISPEKLKAYTSVGGAPHLDGEYTVFGKVIKGLDIIDKIAAQPVVRERPTEDIRIMVTVEEMPRKKIESQFGYHYPEKKK